MTRHADKEGKDELPDNMHVDAPHPITHPGAGEGKMLTRR